MTYFTKKERKKKDEQRKASYPAQLQSPILTPALVSQVINQSSSSSCNPFKETFRLLLPRYFKKMTLTDEIRLESETAP